MSVPNFNEVISSINIRLKTAADSASAEELAYLGSAVEKIAGKASALDLLNETEGHSIAIQALGDSIKDDLTTLKETYQEQHVSAVNDFLTEAESASASVLTAFETSINTAITSLQDAVADSSSMGEATHAKIFFFTQS